MGAFPSNLRRGGEEGEKGGGLLEVYVGCLDCFRMCVSFVDMFSLCH